MLVYTCLGIYPERNPPRGWQWLPLGGWHWRNYIFFPTCCRYCCVSHFCSPLPVRPLCPLPVTQRASLWKSILPCSTDIGLGRRHDQTTGYGQKWYIRCWSESFKNHCRFSQFHFPATRTAHPNGADSAACVLEWRHRTEPGWSIASIKHEGEINLCCCKPLRFGRSFVA